MTVALVAGALANKPSNGGEAWVRLSWVLGLRRLGVEVLFVEELAPEICVDAVGEPAPFGQSINKAYFESVTSRFGLSDSATLICGDVGAGLPYADLVARANDADLLFNISGHLKRPELVGAPRTRVYVDLDPGFTQLWGATGEIRQELDRHEHHVTVGMNVGRAGCPLPTGGLEWVPTLPPVILDEWSQAEPPPEPTLLTTVATWRSPYGQVEFDGELQRLKHHEFRRLVELPQRVPSMSFEVALDIAEEDARDLDALRSRGWLVANPVEVAADPERYREYIRRSGGEFSVAQGVYVSTRSGWFSDRTASYLASGRPALVQDTGIQGILPVGEGLLVFDDFEGAARGAEAIAGNYVGRSRAAREIAERYLDSDLVLGRLLERFAGDSG